MSQITQLEEQFNSTSLRERLLVLITVLVVISYGWWLLSGEKTSIDLAELQDANTQTKAENTALNAGLMALNNEMSKGVVNKKKVKLSNLNQELERLNKQLKLKTVELIDPDDMFKVLSGLVYKQSNLKLLSLKRLSVKQAIQSTDEKNKNGSANAQRDDSAKIFRHVMQMSLSGSYLDISNYMKQLESMDWQLIWDSLTIETEKYPKLIVTVELSTLSDKSKWVGL